MRARVGEARPDHFSENGVVKGIGIDYLNIINERTGIRFDYVLNMPRAAAIESISAGEGVDLLITAKHTPESAQSMVFTDDYLLRAWVIFNRNDSPFISHMDELIGKRVAVERAYVMHEKLEREYPDIRLEVVSNTLEALQALAAGQVDAYVGSLVSGTYLINTQGLANVKVAAPTHFDNHNQAMAIRNDWPMLADIINKVLRAVTPAERQEINSHWLSGRFEYGIQSRDILMWVVPGLALFLVVLLIIARKNRQLQVEVEQRKNAVEVLRRSERRFHVAFDQQFQFMAILAPDGRVLEINERALRAQNYKREDYIGKLFWESPAWRDLPEWSEIWQERLKRAVQERNPILTEDTYQAASGEIRFADAATMAVFDSSGELEYFVVQAFDTTARKRSREERARLNRELSQARKMEALGQLTGGIAHDFNNILAIMLGYSSLCLDMSRKLEQQKLTEYLGKVEQAGNRAKALVAQMLAFSRRDEGEPKPLQLASFVEGDLVLLRSTLPSSIEIESDLRPGLPYVEIDPIQLQQLLMNLTVNARDAMEGSGTLGIALRVMQGAGEECVDCHKKIEGDWVELTVTDSGSGIEAETLEHMFEPFFTTKPVGKGSGMGLAVVHGILTRLGGHIIVETEVGKGSRVRLLFPPYVGSAIVSEGVDAAKHKTPAGAGEHILIVDDEVHLAEYLGELLSLHGYRVSVHLDSRAALEQLKEKPEEIDLLLTDQTMPGMTGNELIVQCRQIRTEIPAILCTGFSEAIDRERASEIGIHYLQKPVQSELILSTIHKALSLKENP